ncbi:unnamed protein product [Prunus armeniaca]|uniref:Uncharacterized protein n=1 Tax=Prunus armeniaca TaxID=36596 RepID=A0A6J5UMZ6_PRUAR|nr:unnamed protein product [Prunus armeniaca]
MPLPWKKMRVNRISQFVADLQSPKRGGSLVVQTGFPTSLVDLFVKNRDHLKKPSKKNKNRKKNNRSADQVNDRITANCELGSGNFGILVQPSSPKVKNLSREEGDRGVEVVSFGFWVRLKLRVGLLLMMSNASVGIGERFCWRC